MRHLLIFALLTAAFTGYCFTEMRQVPPGWDMDRDLFDADETGLNKRDELPDQIPDLFESENAESAKCPHDILIMPNQVSLGDVLTCFSDSTQPTKYKWRNLKTGEVLDGQILEVTEPGSYICTASVDIGSGQCNHSAVINLEPSGTAEGRRHSLTGRETKSLKNFNVLQKAGFGSIKSITGNKKTVIDCKATGQNVIWKSWWAGLRFPTVIADNCQVKAAFADKYEVDTSNGGCSLVVKKSAGVLTRFACYEGPAATEPATLAEVGTSPKTGEEDISISGACWDCDCWFLCISYKPDA
jgi:hypothetical protein